MRGFLLDTNVISELRKENCSENVINNLALIPRPEAFLSSLTFFELAKGTEQLRFRDPRQARNLDIFIQDTLDDYQGRIIPLDEEIAVAAARLCPAQPLPYIDGFLAATAQVHELCFVTRNVSDVRRSGVPILNPFESPYRIQY